jgi:Protein of unknown function (DUF2567)
MTHVEDLPTLAAPSISHRRAAVRVALAFVAAGVLVGALWALLAPPAHAVVALTKAGDRVYAYLGAEADHFFVAAFLLVGMVCVVAVTGSVAAWKWRAHRGPLMALALAVGAIGATAAAAGVGALLVHLRYGTVDVAGAPVTPEHRVHYVTEAPAVFFGHSPLQIATTLLLPAAVSALVYAVAVVATPRDDLGGYPAVEGLVLRTPVTADDGAESVP